MLSELSELSPEHRMAASVMYHWANAYYMHVAHGGKRASWVGAARGVSVGRTTPVFQDARVTRLPLAIVAELGAERQAGQISRLFRWSVAELVGEAGLVSQLPLNQLGLHRRAIAWWTRAQNPHRYAATEDLPVSLQYTPHHELHLSTSARSTPRRAFGRRAPS